MDIERLAKELHGEATTEKNFENEDPYSEDYYKPRN